MKRPIQLSIPQPCHENWADMTPAEKGRFCASCQKNVIDFTRSSDREIVEMLKDSKTTCGRFRTSQLHRDLIVPKEKSKFWAAAGAAAITLLTVGVNEAVAQTPVSTEQHQPENEDSITRVLPEGMITGTVSDNTGMPIPGTNVKVKGRSTGVQTDIDGIFSIEAQEGDTLEFMYVGMETVTIKVGVSENYHVTLLDDFVTDESLMVGFVFTSYSSRIGVASQYMFDY